MTREAALETARANHRAYTVANIDFTMKVWPFMDIDGRERMQRAIDEKHGRQHGWYTVGGFCFSVDEITGVAYDHTQGGWAFL